MDIKIKRLLTFMLLAISMVLVFIGTGLIAMYLWEGIIVRIGDSDQSLIFWYLPILFIGFFSLGSGIVLFIRSYKKIKTKSKYS